MHRCVLTLCYGILRLCYCARRLHRRILSLRWGVLYLHHWILLPIRVFRLNDLDRLLSYKLSLIRLDVPQLNLPLFLSAVPGDMPPNSTKEARPLFSSLKILSSRWPYFSLLSLKNVCLCRHCRLCFRYYLNISQRRPFHSFVQLSHILVKKANCCFIIFCQARSDGINTPIRGIDCQAPRTRVPLLLELSYFLQ